MFVQSKLRVGYCDGALPVMAAAEATSASAAKQRSLKSIMSMATDDNRDDPRIHLISKDRLYT